MGLIAARSLPYPRHWALIGRRSSGKSTFLTAMAQKILVIDLEGRAREIEGVNGAQVMTLDLPDRHDAFQISREIGANAQEIHQQDIRLIGVDSLTTILKRDNAAAMTTNQRGLLKNSAAAFVDKSLNLRLIQESAVSLGLDIALIWHLEEGRDSRGQTKVDQTVGPMERERLRRSLNAAIVLEHKNGRRTARISWSRSFGNTLQAVQVEDTLGFWKGVPEQLDLLLQHGLPVTASQNVS